MIEIKKISLSKLKSNGSGTTMVACEQTQRKARLVEFDPRYCDVIIRRMIKNNTNLTVTRNGIDVTEHFKAK